jgi:hypothetical protein
MWKRNLIPRARRNNFLPWSFEVSDLLCSLVVASLAAGVLVKVMLCR